MSLTADKIAHAPEPLVRAILTALCSDAAVARQAAEFNNKLLTAQYAPAAGTKRKAEDTLMICWQCREAFSQDQNHEKACLFHNGKLEVDDDEDFWADHDENCHGPIDSEWARCEYPEGFKWTCCNKLGDDDGCTRGVHQASKGSRGRYGDDTAERSIKKDDNADDVEAGDEDEEDGNEDSEDDLDSEE